MQKGREEEERMGGVQEWRGGEDEEAEAEDERRKGQKGVG